MNTIAAIATALPIGAALGAAAMKGFELWRHSTGRSEPLSVIARSELWPGDGSDGVPVDRHDGVSADFAAHVRSVREQVSHHADVLAGGDQRLRAELRRFERWTS